MSTNNLAGMRSLAVSYPSEIRTNDYFREKFPDMVANAAEKGLAKLWAQPKDASESTRAFDAAMANPGSPYDSHPPRRRHQRGSHLGPAPSQCQVCAGSAARIAANGASRPVISSN